MLSVIPVDDRQKSIDTRNDVLEAREHFGYLGHIKRDATCVARRRVHGLDGMNIRTILIL